MTFQELIRIADARGVTKTVLTARVVDDDTGEQRWTCFLSFGDGVATGKGRTAERALASALKLRHLVAA